MLATTLAHEFDERKIDAIFADLDQCHLPGGAVGIAIAGKPVYRKGFGLANMEQPVVLSPTVRMRIGSTTKHFACLAFMLLCEDGRAGIDDPLGKHLPELHPVTHQVTMRQLMGHLSGLRDVFDITWQFSGMGHPVGSADLLSMYRHIDEVNDPPGRVWNYNNGAYLMLSTAIERITGQPLEQVLRARIFEPVGMHDTLLRRWDTDFVPNSATLHMPVPGGGFSKLYLGTALAGEGGMVSTVDDMLLWLAHMDAPVVGSAATWEVMKAPMVLSNGASTDYGLGLMTGRYRGVEILHHGGGVLAGNSEMLKVPAAGLDIAVMINRGDVWAVLLAERILDACLPQLAPIRPPARSSIATGVFRSPTTGRVIELFGVDGRQVASIDAVDMPVERDVDGAYWPVGITGYIKQSVILVGDPKAPESVRLSDFGNLDELVREPSPRSIDPDRLVGRFRADTLGVEATISRDGEDLRLTTVGRFGSMSYQLECLAEGLWRARTPLVEFFGGVLAFAGDGGGFEFSTYRTRALAFRRCD